MMGEESLMTWEKRGSTRPPPGKSRGFSLLEILIAIVIFAVGIIAVMYLFPLGVRDITLARELTAATFLGQAKMEEMLLAPADPNRLPDRAEGSFSPDYPLLFFTVARQNFQGKPSLTYISVDVYKLVEGGSRKAIVHYDALRGTGGSSENN
jgi:prepilin-type N-terminal cleavage/methylation domain-containing protein